MPHMIDAFGLCTRELCESGTCGLLVCMRARMHTFMHMAMSIRYRRACALVCRQHAHWSAHMCMHMACGTMVQGLWMGVGCVMMRLGCVALLPGLLR